MTGDGAVGSPDLTLFLPSWGQASGPSGLSCAGVAPCQ